jgi:ferredoxin-NADP reductase
MRAIDHSALPPEAQVGLKDAWKAQGYFLACVCRPNGDLRAGPVDAATRTAVSIASLDRLSESVLRVRLRSQAPFAYWAGQHLTLFRDDGLARSYSIASLPAEAELELHVRLLPGGRMSEWLATDAAPGTPLRIQGPSGDCFYVSGRQDQPLLLAGTGTGLAPLYGILRHALDEGHRGTIHLFHGAMSAAGLYLQDELRALAARHANVIYTPTVLDVDGPIARVLLERHSNMGGWRAFLCGDPTVVHGLRKQLFLAGTALNDIHADAFVPSAAPAAVPTAGAGGAP